MEEWALEQFEFLRNILNPFLEGYWGTAVGLLQLEHTIEGSYMIIATVWSQKIFFSSTEAEFLKELQGSLMEKAERNMLRNGRHVISVS